MLGLERRNLVRGVLVLQAHEMGVEREHRQQVVERDSPITGVGVGDAARPGDPNRRLPLLPKSRTPLCRSLWTRDQVRCSVVN
jgi:hypothetical protein